MLKEARINLGDGYGPFSGTGNGVSPGANPDNENKARKTDPDFARFSNVTENGLPLKDKVNVSTGTKNVEDQNTKMAMAEQHIKAVVDKPVNKYTIEDTEKLLGVLDTIVGIDPSLFVQQDAHPLSLFISLCKWFRAEWFEWEPETLWAEIKSMGVNEELPRIIKDKIMAVRAAHRINNYYSSYHDFELMCATLNNVIPDFHTYRPSSIPEIANAVRILKVVRDDDSYRPEMVEYIKVIAKNEGWLILPEPLSFVAGQDEMLASDTRDRAVELEADPKKFNINSVIDGQAIRLVAYQRYADGEDKRFSDDVQQYIYFKR
jgi:hypothetical protein